MQHLCAPSCAPEICEANCTGPQGLDRSAVTRAEFSKPSVWCRPSGFTNMQTDLSILDGLVEDFLLQEELTDKACLVSSCLSASAAPIRCVTSPLCMQSSYAGDTSCLTVRRACEQVRTLVEQGRIGAALQAVPQQCQAALRVRHFAAPVWFEVSLQDRFCQDI